ncbi:MAG: sulfotransferase [Sulfitobacter sp.]
MSDVFVLSAGRSGSTLLSRMLQEHRQICSVSEFWTSMLMQGFGDPTVSGAAFWNMISSAPEWFRTFIAKCRSADAMPSEIIYDEEQGRYTLEDCPPIATMTLPAFDADPDVVFDALAAVVPGWGNAPVSHHASRLIALLKERFDRQVSVERSGLSYWYAPDMIAAYPKARFVHLTRNGREVLLSMRGMRMFDPIVRFSWMISCIESRKQILRNRMFFHHRGLSRRVMMRFADVERVVTRQHGRARPYSLPDRFDLERQIKVYARFWAASAELGMKSMEALPPDRLYTLRYEDIVADPVRTLTDLMSFVHPGRDHSAWVRSVAHMPVPQKQRWPDLDPALAREVDQIIRPMNDRFGYV